MKTEGYKQRAKYTGYSFWRSVEFFRITILPRLQLHLRL